MTELQSTFEDYVQTDFGFLPRDWSIVKLEDILEEVDLRLSKSAFENLPVLSLTKNRGLILQSDRFIHRIATKIVAKYKVIQKGQIVYNPYVIWEGAIHALKNFEAGIVSPVYAIWEVKPECDWRYVDSLLRTGYMLNEYSKYSSGAVVRRRSIKKNLFLNIQIPLPPIQEQKKIAHILSTIEDALDKSNNSLLSMKELKKSLMKHLFTYGTVNLKDVACVKLKETEIGLMPENWNTKSIGDITVSSQYGLSKRAGNEGKYPMLRMNNLVNGQLDIRDLKYLDLEDNEFSKYKLSKGDVLFNRTNSFELVGKTSLFNLEGNFTFGSYLVRLVIKEGEILPDFLTLYLNWDKSQTRLKSLATKAVGQSNISASRLKTFKIPVPPIEEQNQISSHLEAVNSKIKYEERKKKMIEQLFKSMLNELMTAKVRVNNLEF